MHVTGTTRHNSVAIDIIDVYGSVAVNDDGITEFFHILARYFHETHTWLAELFKRL